MFLQKFEYGETALCFTLSSPPKNGKKTVGLHVLPKGASYEPKGVDAPLFYADFADGSSFPVKAVRQVQFLSGSLNSYLADENGTQFVHKVVYDRDTGVFTANFRYENRGKEEKTLRYFSAFSFGMDVFPGMKIFRMGSAYSYAYAVKCESLEELGLGFESSPPLTFGRDLRYLPFLAIDTGEGVLALRLDAPDKFEMTLRRSEGMLEIVGGERFAPKAIPAGASFETSKVHITLQKDLSSALQALCRRMQRKLTGERESVICSSEGVPLGSMKKFALILKELQVPSVLLEAGKKTWSDEEIENAARKLAVEGVRAEKNLAGFFPLPPFERATAIAAANLSRILPAQKIVVNFPIKAEEEDGETIFNFCAAAMGCIKIKGEIMKLSEGKKELLKSLLSFYAHVQKIVEMGDVTCCEFLGAVASRPVGVQHFEKCNGGEKLVILHFFSQGGTVKVPLDGYELIEKVSSASFTVRGDVLKISGDADTAGAFYLKKREV